MPEGGASHGASGARQQPGAAPGRTGRCVAHRLLTTDAFVAEVLRRVDAAGVGRPVVLLDGRSGSGKTTAGRALADAWPGPVQLVHLDDVYPGWHGLAAASRVVERELLAAVDPGWTTWDWEASRAGEHRTLDPAVPLVVEGAGTVTRASADLATVCGWLELDAARRRRRALARDGAGYEPWWDVWAQQEERHLADEQPVALCDLVVELR